MPFLHFLLLGKEFRETCSGHGRYLVGRCKCDRFYYGTFCEMKDECDEDSDCGVQGKCLDVEATTAPRLQCYCQLGFYGPGCSKRMFSQFIKKIGHCDDHLLQFC